ncbi:MAG: tail fiber domain-containing protein, partial [bacterium]|nr:tail fiber domain-containing protein [bacterium]
LSLSLPLNAVEKKEPALVADVNISAGGLYLQPRVYFSQATLTVSCPDGKVFTRTFESGGSLFQGLNDDKGVMLPDGAYTYELGIFQKAAKMTRGDGNEAGLRKENIHTPQRLIQNGYFTIRGGSMVTVKSEGVPGFRNGIRDDGNATDDHIILDDLIVDGSACIGFDCVNGESFGFDTLRLKENNLRIKFQDTSSAASFPSNDWQITANDSANGGANKFSIDDIDGGRTPFTIEANAPSHSLYVDDGGRVGFGTSIPVVDLHVKSGNTPTLRLEQDGSSGFAPHTWDVAGNEAGFFIRDSTSGSTLPFRIRPGADSSMIDIRADNDIFFGGSTKTSAKMHLDHSNGYLGIGVGADPSTIVHVKTSSVNVGLFESTASDCWFFLENSASGDYNSVGIGSIADSLRFRSGDTEYGRMLANGNLGLGGELAPSYPLEIASANGAHVTTGGVWTSTSSRIFKENIITLTTVEAFDTLNGLTPVKFNYKNEKDENYVGFIAEDVPDMVAQKDRKSLSSMDIVAVLTKVVQEQQKTLTKVVREQQKTIQKMQQQIDQLLKAQKDR